MVPLVQGRVCRKAVAPCRHIFQVIDKLPHVWNELQRGLLQSDVSLQWEIPKDVRLDQLDLLLPLLRSSEQPCGTSTSRSPLAVRLPAVTAL